MVTLGAAVRANQNHVLRVVAKVWARSVDMPIRTRTDLINWLAARMFASSYLEIGVRDVHANFGRVLIRDKHGVDPAPERGTVDSEMTSDDFFAALPDAARYDIVFIDGLHESRQVQRDIRNALRHLSPGGAIIVHDCNPPTEADQVDEYDGVSHWNGTAWKGFARLRAREDLEMCVVKIDEGCGVIRRGNQASSPVPDDLDFAYLDAHRRELLNLLSVPEFKRWWLIDGRRLDPHRV